MVVVEDPSSLFWWSDVVTGSRRTLPEYCFKGLLGSWLSSLIDISKTDHPLQTDHFTVLSLYFIFCSKPCL
ncbi:hypothetical protein Hanom_Chr01g00091561 [Helianthus anomalus]